MIRRAACVSTAFFTLALLGSGPADAVPHDVPLLFDGISLSESSIAFGWSGHVWIMPAGGGPARRLNDDDDEQSRPAISPDGKSIAYSRKHDGATNVYVSNLDGQAQRRLTFHPGPDVVAGWSPDSRRVVFRSGREMPWVRRLYTVSVSGGYGAPLPMAQAWQGAFSPRGDRMLYTSRALVTPEWRAYRGGDTWTLSFADLERHTLRDVSTGRVNDRTPMWSAAGTYFVSDRSRATFNVFRMAENGRAEQLTRYDGYGVDDASINGDRMAIVRDGRIAVLDLRTGRGPVVSPVLPTASSAVRRIAIVSQINNVDVAEDRALVSGRGVVLSLPRSAEPAALRSPEPVAVVTADSSEDAQDAVLSPDGSRIAFFSDIDGEYALYVRSAAGPPATRRIALPAQRAFFGELVWSPDGHTVAFSDTRLSLWVADVDRGTVSLVAHARYPAQLQFDPDWSPDGRTLVYDEYGTNRIRRIIAYDAATRRHTALTDGTVDASGPAFDRTGKTIYFISSPNAGLGQAFGMFRTIYAPSVKRRIVALAWDGTRGDAHGAFTDVPTGFKNYAALKSVAPGRLFVAVQQPGGTDLLDWNAADPKALRPIGSAASSYYFGSHGIAYEDTSGWHAQSAGETTPRALDTSQLNVEVSPDAERREIFVESWRAARDLFYDAGYHGRDIAALREHYARYLPGIRRRADLTTLIHRMLGNLSISHISVNDPAPDTPGPNENTGLLGADFSVMDGRYRIDRVYRLTAAALQIHPESASPLQATDISAGDVLRKVGDTDVDASRDVSAYLGGRAGKPTTIAVSGRSGTRTYTVVPLASEAALRRAAWVERNRHEVAVRSHGTIGYLYLPDFEDEGHEAFVQQLLATVGNAGLIIDERYNPGGDASDFFLDLLRRAPISAYYFRDADPLPFPVVANGGPKTLLINYRNSSAAETFAWAFGRARLGNIVGTRTVGAGVGTWLSVGVRDGGSVVVPMRAFFDPRGRWAIENSGVAPFMEVPISSQQLMSGADPQLERAIAYELQAVRRHTIPRPTVPPPLRFHGAGEGTGSASAAVGARYSRPCATSNVVTKRRKISIPIIGVPLHGAHTCSMRYGPSDTESYTPDTP
jgi:tricorn protease